MHQKNINQNDLEKGGDMKIEQNENSVKEEGVSNVDDYGKDDTTEHEKDQMLHKKFMKILDNSNKVDQSQFELVRLNDNQTAVVTFTDDFKVINLHYCEEDEIEGYVICNGDDCVLCRIGKKRQKRILLPVFLPVTETIGILPVSTSSYPDALLSQISDVLESGKPLIIFISRDRYTYTVSTKEFKDTNIGEDQRKAFEKAYKSGDIDITSVYPQFDNKKLSSVPDISRMLKLKEIPD